LDIRDKFAPHARIASINPATPKIRIIRFLWLGLSGIMADALLSFSAKPHRSHYDTLAFYFVTTILYCGIAVSSQKTVYQGSLFYFPFLLATTLAVGRILMRIGGRAPIAITCVLLATAIIFMPATSFYQFDPKYQDSAPILASVSNAVANEVATARASGCTADRFVFAAMNPDPIPPEAVALDLAMRQRVKIAPFTPYTVRSAAEMDHAVDGADFVILSSRRPYVVATFDQRRLAPNHGIR
jgi:hypothetical protein